MSLPEIISLSDTGHLGHHENLHRRFNETWVSVTDHGAAGDGVTDDTAAILLAMAAAAASTGGVCFFPQGTYLVSGGLDLAGFSCSLVGAGSRYSRIKASAQDQPVVDTTGWAGISSFSPLVCLEGLTLQGDNTADTGGSNVLRTKHGLKVGNLNHAIFRDLLIRDTGGSCIYTDYAMLCSFSDIVLRPPVGCDTNDVPYMYLRGQSNVNQFYSVGFRRWAETGSAGEGVSGALVMEGNATQNPTGNSFFGCWTEYMLLPDGGSIVHVKGNANHFYTWWDADEQNAPGATGVGTCCARFANPAAGTNYGGNLWVGMIPGGVTGWHQYGISLEQSNNAIIGTCKYGSAGKYNVHITNGVGRSSLLFLGQVGTTVAGFRVEDDSAVTTNSWIDMAHIGNLKWDGPAGTYTPSNVTADRSFDADTVVVAELADVVGTLIADLQGQGILQ